MRLNPLARRSERLLLALILLLSLLTGTVKVVRTEAITEDTAVFVAFAQRLEADPVAAMRGCDQHPGFPALMLLAHRTLGLLLAEDSVWRWVRAGQLVSLLAGVALTLAVACYARRLGGRRAGLAAAFLVAVSPALVESRADALSDTAALALLVASAAVVVRLLRRPNGRDAVLAGALAGLGYLVRPEAVQVAVVGGVFLAARSYHRPARAAALALALLLLAAPYAALRGTALTKSTQALLPGPVVVPSDVRCLHYADNRDPEGSSIPAPRAVLERTLGRDSLPGRCLRGGWRLLQGWAFDLGPAAVAAVLTGLWARRRWWRRDPATAAVLVVVALNLALLPAVLFVRKHYLDPRHVLPLSLLSLPWLWAGLCGWSDCLRAWCPLSPRPVLLLLLAALPFLPGLCPPLHGERRGFRDAAEWLAGRAPAQAQLFDATRLVSCLCGRAQFNRWPACAPAPTAETFALLEGQFRGGDLLVVSDRYAGPEALACWAGGRYDCIELRRFPQAPGRPGSACVRIYSIRKEARP